MSEMIRYWNGEAPVWATEHPVTKLQRYTEDPTSECLAIRRACLLLREMMENEGVRVLNLGSGALGMGPYISVNSIERMVDGDISLEMLTTERKRWDRVTDKRLLMDAAANLPFADEQFDGVTAFFLHRYLRAREQWLMMREALRVLRSGGEIFLLDYESSWGHPMAVSEFRPERFVLWYGDNLSDWEIKEVAPAKEISPFENSYHGRVMMFQAVKR